MKIKSDKRNKYVDLSRELKKKQTNYEGDSNTNRGWCTCDNPQRIGKGTGRLGNKSISKDYPDNSVIKIGQNTEKTLGDLMRLAVTQTTVRRHQLRLLQKTLKGVSNNEFELTAELE